MNNRYRPLGLLLLTLSMIAGRSPAHAAVITTVPDKTLTATPYSISFGSGVATYAFNADNTGSGPGADVATGGTALVSNFFGLTDFEANSVIGPGGLYNFTAFPTATYIPNSVADDFIGLAFTLADGLHYGYAEVSGSELVSYAYDTTAGEAILTEVPEPAALPVMATALIGLFAFSGRRFSFRGLRNSFRQVSRISPNA